MLWYCCLLQLSLRAPELKSVLKQAAWKSEWVKLVGGAAWAAYFGDLQPCERSSNPSLSPWGYLLFWERSQHFL